MATTKREAILEAALELFVEKGIHATTTREIAARAETAEGNIYRHFQSKDELSGSLFDACTEMMHAALSEAIRELNDPADQLRALVAAIFEFADRQPTGFAYILTAHPVELARSRKEPLPLGLFRSVMQRGMEAGAFLPLDPVMAIGWIVSMTQRAILLHRSGRIGLSREDVISQTIEGALRLVSPRVD